MFYKLFKIIFISSFLFFSSSVMFSQNTAEHELIISVERIWDRATHNAFTSLIDFNGSFYCAFRESNGHVSDVNGSIRVIKSDDGENWFSVAHIIERGVDLRDPQLSVTKDKRIMLNIAGSIYKNGKLEEMIPKICFSDSSGRNFSTLQNIVLDERIKTKKDWLWRATWHKGRAFATVYQPSKEKSVQLIVSDDGINYKYITTLDIIGGNETTLRFTSDDKMIAVVRRDGERNGIIGISEPPYKTWALNELEERLGGPDLILLDDETLLCATREYPKDHNEKTIIAKVSTDGKFTKLLTLPSGGDCSYPGLVLKKNILYVSYYSSHEEKTAIYFARVAELKYGFDSFEPTPRPIVDYDKNGVIKLSCKDKSANIVYTLDGSMPSPLNGYRYKDEILISKTSILRTIAFKDRTPVSKTLSQNIGIDIFQKPQVVSRKLASGLKYRYYEGKSKSTLKIKELSKIKSGIVDSISTSFRMRDDNYAFVYNGFIYAPNDGIYSFYLTSNDGSRLYINDELVINNDGAHGKREESVNLSLGKGFHKIELFYFQLGGGKYLSLEWSSESFERRGIEGKELFH